MLQVLQWSHQLANTICLPKFLYLTHLRAEDLAARLGRVWADIHLVYPAHLISNAS